MEGLSRVIIHTNNEVKHKLIFETDIYKIAVRGSDALQES
jgi:hypothetical protein